MDWLFNLDWLFALDLLGCGVFALSGAILAYQQKMDGIGVVVLAAVTAIGGGTIRDLLLDAPVFWLNQTNYLYMILLSSGLAILWINRFQRLPHKALEFADALGLALFVVMGTDKALSMGVPPVTAVVMGTITGCFGGVIRDVLANQVPLILRKELYAVCCILGGTVYVLFAPYTSLMVSSASAFLKIFILRLIAIKWQLSIPVFRYRD